LSADGNPVTQKGAGLKLPAYGVAVLQPKA